MTSIMWPTRSRVSQPVQRVITFQFFGSDTSRVKLARSRRITVMTVSLPSAAIGLTGAITTVLISSFPSRGQFPDHPQKPSVPCASRRGGRYDDRRQVELEVFALPFVLGRKLQRRAERVGRLVYGEARLVGRDLKKDASGLAEIYRPEVFALDHRRHVPAGLDKDLAPFELVGVVAGAPGDVVDGADRLLADGRLRCVEHVDDRAGTSGAGLEAGAVALFGDLEEAHGVGEEMDRGFVRLLGQRDRMEAADGVVWINGSIGPRLPALI